jgi:hypothetical protein
MASPQLPGLGQGELEKSWKQVEEVGSALNISRRDLLPLSQIIRMATFRASNPRSPFSSIRLLSTLNFLATLSSTSSVFLGLV